MTDATRTQTNWRVRLRPAPLLGPALLLSLAAYLLLCLLTADLSTMPASAMPPLATPASPYTHGAGTIQSTHGPRATPLAPAPPNDAYMQLVPGASGNCSPPPNGGSTHVGCRFVLQLMVNSGSHNDVDWQQSYLSFTHELLQNARVSSIGAGCALTNVVTPDSSSFDAVLQNEVCNGPDPCIFPGGGITDPGSIAYVSTNLFRGRGGTFRVAEIGVCATSPGKAVLHWQFSPPAPPERGTGILSPLGWVHDPALFTDYAINIVNATLTPIPTVTPGGPPTYTPTPTVTNTRTPVPPITATPPPCGLAWRVVDSPNPSSFQNGFGGVAAVSPDDVWAVGSYATGTVPTVNTLIEHWDGTRWTQVPSPSPHDNTLTGAAAVSANDVWAVGYNYPCCGTNQALAEQSLIEHWDGNQWSIIPGAPFPYTQTNILHSVAAISPNDVWAVGYYAVTNGPFQTLVEHWNGIQWNLVPSPNATTDRNNLLWDVAAVSANDVWAVGFYTADDVHISDQSLIQHWDGSQWSIVPSPSVPGSYRNRLRGISAISANDIWAVGNMDDGTYSFHWDGAQWNLVLTPYFAGSEVILSVKALSTNDVWAVGDYFFSAHGETLMLHWDGHTWTQVPSPSPRLHENRLLRIGAASPTDVWAVGYSGDFAGQSLTLVEHYSDPCSGRTPTPTPATPTTATATRTRVPAGTPTATATPCPMSFSDVHEADYFYGPVRYLFCRGVISGYADGTFRPYNNTTRGQLAKIVVLGFGIPIYTPPAPTFQDVPSSQTFYQYIETAYHSNLVSGYNCGGPGEPCPGLYFRPGNDVTRGQLCKIVVLAAGWPLLDPSTPTFRDVPVGSPFFRYVETAYAHGIISGYSCGPNCLEFRPGNNATRGQICKIVYLAIAAP